jgi:hypothetical protein
MRKPRPLVSAIAYRISDWGHTAVFQTAADTAGAVCLNKTARRLSVQRTIVAASRHSHDDVSGGHAKELREGRGVCQGGL